MELRIENGGSAPRQVNSSPMTRGTVARLISVERKTPEVCLKAVKQDNPNAVQED